MRRIVEPGPGMYDVRRLKKFLWLPMTAPTGRSIVNQILLRRWLEWAEWEEMYNGVYWETMCWLDLEKEAE